MEEEKKEPTLEELYAPSTSADGAPAERPKKKWSVGLVMDLVFSTVAIVGAILSVLSCPELWRFFGQSVDRDSLHFAIGVPMALLSVLASLCFPFVAVPIRIVTAAVTTFRKTASEVEFTTFFGYLVVSGISFLLVQYFAKWVFYIT